jgi:hypothetical protein
VDYLEFESACLDLIDEIEQTGMSIVVTREGRPYGVLRPHQPGSDELSEQ